MIAGFSQLVYTLHNWVKARGGADPIDQPQTPTQSHTALRLELLSFIGIICAERRVWSEVFGCGEEIGQ